MHKDRLLMLAAFLRTVPEDKFDMSVWSDNPAPPTIGCGYAGCAMGYACGMPEFQRLGLQWHHPAVDAFGCPRYGDDFGLMTAASFFGIPVDDAYELFSPTRYDLAPITPAMVADRIEKLVAES